MTSVSERPDALANTEENFHHWIQQNPELGAGPISADRFISPEFFDFERDQVFSKSWVNVGSVHDLGSPGAFFVREIDILGVSLLVVQQDDGSVQAFHNVCSHRLNKLIWEEKGTCPRLFACRFHGWSYGRDGALVDVPDEGGFYDLDKSQLGLVPVRTETWNGFVFVTLNADAPSLAESLGGLGESLKDFPFDQYRLDFRFDVREKANWKVALDAQNEIYHIPMLAPLHRFLGEAFESNDDGYTRISDFEKFGAHTVWCTGIDPEFRPSGVEAAILEACSFGAPRFPIRAPFVFHVLFPNMVIAFFGNMMFTYNFWPVAVDETVWEVRFHYPEPRNLADRVAIEQMKCRIRDAVCEDQFGHEALQVGLTSRARPSIVLQDQEIQIRNFHHALDQRISGESNG